MRYGTAFDSCKPNPSTPTGHVLHHWHGRNQAQIEGRCSSILPLKQLFSKRLRRKSMTLRFAVALYGCADRVQAVAGPAILPAESVGMPASAVGAYAALPPQYAGNHRVRCVASAGHEPVALLLHCLGSRSQAPRRRPSP